MLITSEEKHYRYIFKKFILYVSFLSFVFLLDLFGKKQIGELWGAKVSRKHGLDFGLVTFS